jgi:ADP-heptose:LPS heptosyltransferase
VRPAEAGEEPVDDPGEFLQRIRAERFDVAVQLHGGGRHTNPLVRALGARVTAGLRATDAEPLDRWIRYIYYQPEVFRYLEVAGLLGARPVTVEPRLALMDADITEARAVAGAPAGQRVALHPGASDPRRRWPAERFAEVADALTADGCEVVLTATPGERDIVERVCRAAGSPPRAFIGALSLGGLAATYADCAVVVSNDTGPLHLAAAVGAATVGIYWVGNLINGALPLRARHRALPSWTIHCPQCGADCTRDIYPDRAGGPPCGHRVSFVADIPVVEVLEAVTELLAAHRVQSYPLGKERADVVG